MKRLGITGASGLIGSALVDFLSSQPVEILRLCRVSGVPDPKEFADAISRKVDGAARIASLPWNPSEGVLDVRRLENLDAILHLAGRPLNVARWNEIEKARLRDSRVLTTQRLVEQIASLERKPAAFLSASAVGIYGDCGARWLSETEPPANDFLGRLAEDWEAAARPLEAMGVRVVFLRFGVVLSKAGGALAKILPIFRSGLGGRLGSGQQYMSWIGLPDCVQAILFLLERPDARGPYNVVSPQPVTNQEFTNVLGKVLRRPTLFPAPKTALRLALGEMADALLLSSQRASSRKIQELGFAFSQPGLEEVLRSELN